MKKKIVIMCILCIGLFLIPNSVFASLYTKKAKEDIPTTETTTNQNMVKIENANCSEYLFMNIKADPYSRIATRNNDGTYVNEVKPRKITFVWNKSTYAKGKYNIVIYHGPIGSLDTLNSLSDEDVKKYNDADEDDGDDNNKGTEEEDKIEVKSIKIKKGTTDKTWNLPPGEEALIVMLNGSKKYIKNAKGELTKYRGGVAAKDDKGNPIKWYVNNAACPKGTLKKGASDLENPVIEGNGVALYVQNPNENSLLINNVNKNSEACNNARNGIYSTGSSKYNVTDKEAWSGYYNKVLKDFCDDTSVSFNLSEKDITKLSDNLLKIFYYNNKIKVAQDNGEILTFEQINDQVNKYKKEIEDFYYDYYKEKYVLSSTGSKESILKSAEKKAKEVANTHIIEEEEGQTTDLTDDELSCRYDPAAYATALEYSGRKMFEEKYLYVTKEKNITAKISKANSGKGKKTKSIDVCSTKCYEHLNVRYDIPQTVKAGMCFSYKVTIKSESYCGITIKDYWSQLNIPKACSPVAICNNKKEVMQAGPNEDFDSCINACDGGKYTQTCINSCYKKVYQKQKNVSKTSTSTSKKNSKVSSLTNISKKYTIQRLANVDNSDSALENYYKLDSVSPNHACSTSKLVDYIDQDTTRKTTKVENDDMLTKCAQFFLEAKSLYPHGTYKCINDDCSADSESGGNLKWVPDGNITNGGNTKDDIGVEGNNIPMQIGRASPYYLRDVASTKDLLKSLIGFYNSRKKWYKYVIKSKDNVDAGVKQNKSSRFTCSDECSFTGCSASKDEDVLTAYNSGEYSTNLNDDLKEIAKKIKKCHASNPCGSDDDESDNTTTYEIEIKAPTKAKKDGEYVVVEKKGKSKGNVEKTLENDVEHTFTASYENGKSNSADSVKMFVSEKEDGEGNGILGLCYSNSPKTPHYQTTITYPGTYVNYKTGGMSYTDDIDNAVYKKKEGLFCTPYNQTNINEKYWYWATMYKYDTDAYPTNFTPSDWNIEAKLGKENGGFGKYNWKINFSCFYSSYDQTPDCPEDDPDYPTCKHDLDECPKTDPCYQYPGCKCPEPITEKNECDSKLSTKFCNVRFRVVDTENLFPDSNGNAKPSRDLPFNWSSKAQDKNPKYAGNNDGAELLKDHGYGIDPYEYKTQVETNNESIYNENPMYRIIISKEGIKELKEYVKTHGYNSYLGVYTPITSGSEIVRYYTMPRELKNIIYENSNSIESDRLGYNSKR